MNQTDIQNKFKSIFIIKSDNLISEYHEEAQADRVHYIQKHFDMWNKTILELCDENNLNPNEMIEMKGTNFNSKLSVNYILKTWTMDIYQEQSIKLFSRNQSLNKG